MLSRVLVLAFVVVMTISCVQYTEARSHGLLGTCDLTPQNSNGQWWPNGKYGKDKDTGADSGAMSWVKAPKASPAYTIRSGDGALSADPTSYQPGVPMEIHLRVNTLDLRFIGLVMYATNNAGVQLPTKETNVGSWLTTPGEEYQVPASCGGKAVTHTNANIKPLHSRFIWQAPAGTGTVKFRVLIKQGEQNKGAFFWPVKELVLTERALSQSTSTATIIGAAGQACATVCAASATTKYCNAGQMMGAQSPAQLDTLLNDRTAFRLPLLAGCTYAGVPQLNEQGYASFRAPNVADACPASYVNGPPATRPDVCYTAPLATNRAICSCSNDASVQTANPFARAALTAEEPEIEEPTTVELLTDAPVSAAAAGQTTPLLAFAVASAVTAAASFKASRSTLFLVLALALLCVAATPAQAHNYIKSQHRAWEAAVSAPCQARIGNQPHVQVRANQDFEIEWSVGHGDYPSGSFYFAILAEKDYDKLKVDNLPWILQDYVNNAPNDARNTDPKYERHHIHNDGEDMPRWDYYFKEWSLSNQDWTFIWRDDIYRAKAHPNKYTDPNKVIQKRFKDNIIANDRRVSYRSDKYPWLESVSMFTQTFTEHFAYNDQADIARFNIPARSGAGNYIVYFNWAGYQDCVDVNVQNQNTDIQYRYGAPSNNQAGSVVKLDHCEYTNIPYTATGCHKMNSATLDASQCINECLGNKECTSVQVVRKTNVARALPYVPNIPNIQYVWDPAAFAAAKENHERAAEINPCMHLSVQKRVNFGCKQYSDWCDNNLRNEGGVSDSDYVCYGLRAMRNQDNQVEEDYRIATEPEDPVWYSTCMQIVPAGGFINIPEFKYTAPSWDAGDSCVDCAFHKKLQTIGLRNTPNWANAVGLTCQNCDIKNSAASVAQLPLAGANQATTNAPAPTCATPPCITESISGYDVPNAIGKPVGTTFNVGLNVCTKVAARVTLEVKTRGSLATTYATGTAATTVVGCSVVNIGMVVAKAMGTEPVTFAASFAATATPTVAIARTTIDVGFADAVPAALPNVATIAQASAGSVPTSMYGAIGTSVPVSLRVCPSSAAMTVIVDLQIAETHADIFGKGTKELTTSACQTVTVNVLVNKEPTGPVAFHAWAVATSTFQTSEKPWEMAEGDVDFAVNILPAGTAATSSNSLTATAQPYSIPKWDGNTFDMGIKACLATPGQRVHVQVKSKSNLATNYGQGSADIWQQGCTTVTITVKVTTNMGAEPVTLHVWMAPIASDTVASATVNKQLAVQYEGQPDATAAPAAMTIAAGTSGAGVPSSIPAQAGSTFEVTLYVCHTRASASRLTIDLQTKDTYANWYGNGVVEVSGIGCGNRAVTVTVANTLTETVMLNTWLAPMAAFSTSTPWTQQSASKLFYPSNTASAPALPTADSLSTGSAGGVPSQITSRAGATPYKVSPYVCTKGWNMRVMVEVQTMDTFANWYAGGKTDIAQPGCRTVDVTVTTYNSITGDRVGLHVWLAPISAFTSSQPWLQETAGFMNQVSYSAADFDPTAIIVNPVLPPVADPSMGAPAVGGDSVTQTLYYTAKLSLKTATMQANFGFLFTANVAAALKIDQSRVSVTSLTLGADANGETPVTVAFAIQVLQSEDAVAVGKNVESQMKNADSDMMAAEQMGTLQTIETSGAPAGTSGGKKSGGSSILIPIIVGVAAAVILAVIVGVVLYKRKQKKSISMPMSPSHRAPLAANDVQLQVLTNGGRSDEY